MKRPWTSFGRGRWRVTWRTVLYAVLLLVALSAATVRLTGIFGDTTPEVPTVRFTEPKQATLPDSGYQKYLVIVQDSDIVPDTQLTKESVLIALQYGKLPYDQLTFSEWAAATPDLAAYRQGAVIVIGERQANLAHVDALTAYVREQGGTLVQAMRTADSPLAALFGVNASLDFVGDAVGGLNWKIPIYPGLEEKQLDAERYVSSSLAVTLPPDAQVWAESMQPTPPVPQVWFMRQGQGRTLYWNTTALQEKIMRGAFLQSLLRAQGEGVKLALNAQVWYIDDYPAPAYDRVSEGNTTGLTDLQFRLQQFNPDMHEIAKRYGLRYTAGVIFEYNNRIAPPFALTRSGSYQRLFQLEAGLVAQTGELSLHGYNHLPLMLTYTPEESQEYGYPAWSDPEAMRAALEEARRLWEQEVKAPLPTLYIPPSNVLGKRGKQLLLDVFPELRTISSIYVSNSAYAALEQEFLPDPDHPQVVGTPRITYGFELTPNQFVELAGGVASIGVVSHFNHPDDVFHDERNQGQTWQHLYATFDKLVGDVQSYYPWLRKLTGSEFADALRDYLATDVRIDRSQPGRIRAVATPLRGPLYLEAHVQTPEQWQVKQGGAIVHRDLQHGLLWVRMDEPELELEGPR